jgi:hypothetical protein
MAAAACSGGVCKGEPRDCDDGDPCTTDVCFGDHCVHDSDPAKICGVPEDPCLVPVCDGECGLAPAPDGTSCAPATCSIRHVCAGGLCTAEAVEDGASCEGKCGIGTCVRGSCSGDEALRLAWQVSTSDEPRLDPVSGSIFFEDGGSIYRITRDGSRTLFATPDDLQWGTSGIGGRMLILSDSRTNTVLGIPIDGSIPGWTVDMSAFSSWGRIEASVVLADGRTVVAMSDGVLILLDGEGGFVTKSPLCNGSEFVLVADERERIFAASVCSTETETRELRLMEFDRELGKRADVLIASQPRFITGLRVQAATGGYLLLYAHLSGERSFLVDMNRGSWTEFRDFFWATTLTETSLFVRDGNSLRALAPESGREQWAMDAADLPGACGSTACSGEWYGADVLATERGTLWVAGHFDRPAVLEVAPGGTVLRSCTIPDVELFAGATIMDGRLVALAGRWFFAAWDLPGRQSLASGWFGSGGPAGGRRAHSPPRTGTASPR